MIRALGNVIGAVLLAALLLSVFLSMVGAFILVPLTIVLLVLNGWGWV